MSDWIMPVVVYGNLLVLFFYICWRDCEPWDYDSEGPC